MYAKPVPKGQSIISDEEFFSLPDKVREKNLFIYLYICLEN